MMQKPVRQWWGRGRPDIIGADIQIRESIKYDNQNLYYKENNVKTSVTKQSRIMRAQVFFPCQPNRTQ